MHEKTAKVRAIIAVALTVGILLSGWLVLGAYFPSNLRPESPEPASQAEPFAPASSLYALEPDNGYLPDDPEQGESEPDDPGQDTSEQDVPPDPELDIPTEQGVPEPDDTAQDLPPIGGDPEHGDSGQGDIVRYHLGQSALDEPVVGENIAVMPRQDTFTIMQAFEMNGFTPSRLTISFVQLGYSPGEGEAWRQVMITDQAHIQAAWEILSRLEVTSRGAAQVEFSSNQVAVDFSFTDSSWNWGASIQALGPVYILGRGPFVFAEGSSAQPFIDLLNGLTS